MENQHDKLIQKIDSERPSLSKKEKEVIWSALASQTIDKKSIPSPYAWLAMLKRPIMAPIALTVVLMLGTTGLVAASEPTRPGDTLFAVKQATESIRLALASDDARVRLEAEFAAERLIELSSILEESLAEYKNSNATTSLKTEDEKRVNEALGITLSYLGRSNLSSSTKDSLYSELASLLQGAPVRIDDEKLKSIQGNSRIEIRNDDDDKRIEIEDGENRIRIREKDGELRIDYKDKEDDEEDRDDDRSKYESDDSDSDRDEDNQKTDAASLRFEAEADVFGDKTVVEVEINDKKTRFETTASTKEAVANEIAKRFGIDVAIVMMGLDFEIEDKSHDEDNSDEENVSRSNEDNSSDDDDQNNDSSDDSNDSEVRIEVRVEDGEAEVKVDGQNDDEFTLPYSNTNSLISAIASRTGLSEAVISSNLDLEIKD